MHGMHGKASDFDCFREVIIERISGDIVVYAIKCNESDTSDGIRRGGERAANEVDNLLSTYGAENIHDISIVGHSLGGLYARYMITVLESLPKSVYHTARKRQFITLASPHLGATYHLHAHAISSTLKVLTSWMSHTLPVTHRELLLCDEHQILQMMATAPEFIKAWCAFETSVLYSNVWHDALVSYCSSAVELFHLGEHWETNKEPSWKTVQNHPNIYDRVAMGAHKDMPLPIPPQQSPDRPPKSELDSKQFTMCLSLQASSLKLTRFDVKDRFLSAHTDICAIGFLSFHRGKHIIQHVATQLQI
jgi:triacylglycerol esterase/lipase EstA (alpha/beta hydrolase family)